VIAALAFVSAKQPLVAPEAPAELDADDADYLQRHVDKLQAEASAADSLRSQFKAGSIMEQLLQQLRDKDDASFVEATAIIAGRVKDAMDASTNTSPGVLAVVRSPIDESAQAVSILKLDAINEAARFALEPHRIRISVLRHLLPAPGDLHKGVSWPDPRPVSDAIVLERNASAARYFFNACELDVSLRSKEAEKALHRVLIQVPRERRPAVAAEIAQLSGPVEKLAAAIKQREPDISTDLPELGSGGRLGGLVRPGKLAAGRTRFSGDGIDVLVPYDLLGRVSIQPHGGGWQMTIGFTTQPTEEAG
jgi:37-kD nucleoid-associated bacterial protein